jgi:DNA-binding response OmpR family regulator
VHREILDPEYCVHAAFDGDEGLRKAMELSPDLVLTDLEMPKMSGDQLVCELRQIPALATVPIVVLTAQQDEALRVKLLRQGALDYLAKPFAEEEIRARVHNLVSVKRALDRAQDQLKQANCSRQRLLSMLSRQFRGPLAVLRRRLNTLGRLLTKADKQDDRLTSLLEAARRQSSRLEPALDQLD